MITYLKVRNLAIVEEVAIEPGPGLNVLTGETGAGKSLLIDSLELLRGARGSADMIRSGSERMTAEAVFHLPIGMAGRLDELGIEWERAGETVELIVRREVAAGGRARVLINGSPLAVRELAATMDAALEIHGQSESHHRVAGQTYRELLDEYGGHSKLLEATRSAFRTWKEAAQQFSEMAAAERDRTLRLDLLKYQIDEIAQAQLTPEEESSLKEEKAILSHARETIEATEGAYELIDADESSATSNLSRALHRIQPLARHIAELEQIAGEIQDLLYRTQEVGRTLASLAQRVRHDPARLEHVEERLATIQRLEKKYGGTVEAVLAHLRAIEEEFDQLTDYETTLEKLRAAESTLFADYRKAAEKLSAARRKAARLFEKSIQTELNDLAMERTTVRVAVEPLAREGESGIHESSSNPDTSRGRIGPDGVDRVEILIAPNRGEEPRPMQRIASGGELSRIQLAIAAALFKASPQTAAATLVFDEIDAGIGGRVAEVVGRKLRELAARNQVICVTHLPQIASFGTTHFYVWKDDEGGHTRASIRRLDDGEERVAEIARMLGGESIPASAVAHARELLTLSSRS